MIFDPKLVDPEVPNIDPEWDYDEDPWEDWDYDGYDYGEESIGEEDYGW